MRRCSKCKEEKPEELFSWIKTTAKWHCQCKACLAAGRRADRLANPQRYRSIDRKRHSEERRAANREYHHRNRDKLLPAIRERQDANRDQYNANRRARLLSDPGLRTQRSAANKEWRDRNADLLRTSRADTWRNTEPETKFTRKFSASISRALKRGTKRGRKSEHLLGYTYAQLRVHLQRQFVKGMSWANYGEWHVDHIRPLSSFNYSGPDDPEFRECWALTNLRPLWAKVNMSKHAKRLYLL